MRFEPSPRALVMKKLMTSPFWGSVIKGVTRRRRPFDNFLKNRCSLKMVENGRKDCILSFRCQESFNVIALIKENKAKD